MSSDSQSNKMKQFKTVTIAIPVHNEEENIFPLLMQIASQNERTCKIKRVLVVLDGCTDLTFENATKAAKKDSRIKVLNDGKRKGKMARMNQIYALNTTSILIFFDSDVRILGKNVVKSLTQEFNHEKVGLVGGFSLPEKTNRFFQKIAYTSEMLWFEVRKDFKKGHNGYNHHGSVSAIAKELTSKIRIPETVNADDAYLYYRTIELGYKFRVAHHAVVYHQAPATVSEYFFQNARFLAAMPNIRKHFGLWINDHRIIPKKYKVSASVKIILNDPFFGLCAIVFQFLSRYLMPFYVSKYSNLKIWQRINSN